MIKITTDSTCDLPRSLLERHHISVTPLGIVKNDRLYRDGIDIRPADIARHVDGGGDITTTSAVNIADYEVFFREHAAKHDAVIHLNIGSGFSSCHQNAKIAAEDVEEVYVVDTQNLSAGHGLLVLAAAEAAEAGKSVAEILNLLDDLIPRVEISFILDRLDYMKKGGRCSAVAALGANLLKLHPCIEVVSGKMSVTKKFRGSPEKVMRDYLKERLTGRTNVELDRILLVDTCEDDHLAAVGREFLQEDGRFAEVIETKAGCTVFSHCGPGVLGLILLRK